MPSDLGVLKNQILNLGVESGVVPPAYFPLPTLFANLRAGGHELTIHPYIGQNYVYGWSEYWRAFTQMRYGPVSPTTRTHDLYWLGWAEAARIQAGERFDVLLCDVMMPQLSGPDFHAELTRTSPELARRLVFITGGAFTPGAVRYLETSGNRVLEKPFEAEALQALVRELLP